MDQYNKRLKKLETILEHYGFDAQQEKLVEECEELIEAALGEDYNNFIEELADVDIVITELMMLFDVSTEEFYSVIDRKVQRIKKRLKERI